MKGVDLFAGFGGFTEGATQAGVNVVWAANHWPTAVQVHSTNHPDTAHECQDLQQADFTKLPRYDWLFASPACQGHSTASQPKRRKYHDSMRATAWSVVTCAEVTEPRGFVVENVPSFLHWSLYDVWHAALTRLGYHLQTHTLNATDFGVPQRRKRLFIVGTRKKVNLHLPEKQKEPPFEPCIDWSAGGWRPTKSATEQAQARFAKARARGLHTFLSQHVTAHPGVPLDEPIRTITCAHQHWTLVDGDRYRYLTARELARGMGFPERYEWPVHLSPADVTQGLGNAVPPPMAAGVIRAALAAA